MSIFGKYKKQIFGGGAIETQGDTICIMLTGKNISPGEVRPSETSGLSLSDWEARLYNDGWRAVHWSETEID